MEQRRLLNEAGVSWDAVAGSLKSEGTQWHFMPPSSSHFGELWEAGVKSMNANLSRVHGSCRLTFENFATLLVEVEAVLNGHPLSPLTGSLDDLDPLPPAHFLIGCSSPLGLSQGHARSLLDSLKPRVPQHSSAVG